MPDFEAGRMKVELQAKSGTGTARGADLVFRAGTAPAVAHGSRHDGDFVFELPSGAELLRLCADGRVVLRGEQHGYDRELLQAFRSWLANAYPHRLGGNPGGVVAQAESRGRREAAGARIRAQLVSERRVCLARFPHPALTPYEDQTVWVSEKFELGDPARWTLLFGIEASREFVLRGGAQLWLLHEQPQLDRAPKTSMRRVLPNSMVLLRPGWCSLKRSARLGCEKPGIVSLWGWQFDLDDAACPFGLADLLPADVG